MSMSPTRKDFPTYVYLKAFGLASPRRLAPQTAARGGGGRDGAPVGPEGASLRPTRRRRTQPQVTGDHRGSARPPKAWRASGLPTLSPHRGDGPAALRTDPKAAPDSVPR